MVNSNQQASIFYKDTRGCVIHDELVKTVCELALKNHHVHLSKKDVYQAIEHMIATTIDCKRVDVIPPTDSAFDRVKHGNPHLILMETLYVYQEGNTVMVYIGYEYPGVPIDCVNVKATILHRQVSWLASLFSIPIDELVNRIAVSANFTEVYSIIEILSTRGDGKHFIVMEGDFSSNAILLENFLSGQDHLTGDVPKQCPVLVPPYYQTASFEGMYYFTDPMIVSKKIGETSVASLVAEVKVNAYRQTPFSADIALT